jgi:tetratricopeptide (TPR) repeat protein
MIIDTLAKFRVVLCLLSLVMVTSCGGKVKIQETGLDAWNQAMDSGHDAVILRRYSVAETNYQEALRIAILRNDARRIGEAGYNLAVVELSGGYPDKALKQINQTEALLSIRSDHSMERELGLVKAAAFYRLGQDQSALKTALPFASARDPVGQHACLVAGLAAFRLGDMTSLEHVSKILAEVKRAPSDMLLADRMELLALEKLRTDAVDALHLAERVADLRRKYGDFRGMERALRLAASAADLAGQGAMAQSLKDQAEQSLKADKEGTPEAGVSEEL